MDHKEPDNHVIDGFMPDRGTLSANKLPGNEVRLPIRCLNEHIRTVTPIQCLPESCYRTKKQQDTKTDWYFE